MSGVRIPHAVLMKHKIGDLVKTAIWFGTIIDTDTGNLRGIPYTYYKVQFWFPDDRLSSRWCSEDEVNKWKRNLLDATK